VSSVAKICITLSVRPRVSRNLLNRASNALSAAENIGQLVGAKPVDHSHSILALTVPEDGRNTTPHVFSETGHTSKSRRI